MRFLIAVLLTLPFVLPAYAKTYKGSFPVPCNDMWPAVKAVLSQADLYDVAATDDAAMHADYDVKHQAHVTITGAILQRQNHVSLKTKGSGCEMDVVSNFSGWEHNDQGDFRKRVEEAIENQQAAPPAQPTKPAEPTK